MKDSRCKVLIIDKCLKDIITTDDLCEEIVFIISDNPKQDIIEYCKEFLDFARPNETTFIHDTVVKGLNYSFTRFAPCEAGTYILDVQIVATGLTKTSPSGKVRYLLVASEEGGLTTVPEFTTIAIPVAAIFGLLFFFNHRKHRKESK